ncbi:fibroblast growth factor 19 [Girardinichthys multiradiatus]|uniref:fibroblast growth factor 19 n=1 Tax=Girardinichthys multiradiatus TaxID=208333 RepID=UPI001FAD7217|nr:fibroblast growth factor 19 [Girardinichthys multiradiatus]
MLLLVFIVCIASELFTLRVFCMPMMDQGPHISHGWGQVVRLLHLYAAKPGLHLLITEDGQIHGSADQTLYSLLEIRPVGPGHVVIRGVATTRFLCIEINGRLYTSQTYTKTDCTFREQILADGYNIYTSDGHGAILSLGNTQQRLHGLDQGLPALARFLPRENTLQQSIPTGLEVPDQLIPEQEEETVDTVASFGKLSQIIHSPSFHKR